MKQVLWGMVLLLGVLVCPVYAANDLDRSPMLIDTATPTPIRTAAIKIVTLRWVNVTTAGHKIILSDSTGRKIFETTCPTGATEYELTLPFASQRGLSVTQIDSGLLYIHYE